MPSPSSAAGRLSDESSSLIFAPGSVVGTPGAALEGHQGLIKKTRAVTALTCQASRLGSGAYSREYFVQRHSRHKHN